MSQVRVYIGLGSNLNHPVQQLNQALQSLQNLPQIQLQQVSRFYQNPPMGPQDQPDFVNAVAGLDTCLEPLELLDCLQQIESEQGRQRDGERRWGERTLDLDILLYGNNSIENQRITVPHSGLTERCFFLLPLYEIAPNLRLPSGELLVNYILPDSKALLVPISGRIVPIGTGISTK